MTFARIAVTLFFLLGPIVETFAADGCERIWSPEKLARAAKRLDQQVICMRALLRPLPLQDRSSPSLYVYEAVPLDGKQRRDTNLLGLMDWDKELGIDESSYRPESYDLFDQAAMGCPRVRKDDLTYDVELRAVVEYKKNLTEHAYAVLPPNLLGHAPRRNHYDIELVVLEILKATAVCRK